MGWGGGECGKMLTTGPPKIGGGDRENVFRIASEHPKMCKKFCLCLVILNR